MSKITDEKRRGAIEAFALPSGSLVNEFHIESVLGYGAFGITYLAVDTLLQDRVALKEYFPSSLAVRVDGLNVDAKGRSEQSAYDDGLASFLQEAQLIARFDHRNLMRIRRFFRHNGTAYFVSKYENGLSLRDYSARHTIGEPALRAIIAGIIDGLEVIHAGAILHRDLKPSNVLIAEGLRPILIDFGAAREFDDGLSHALTAIGTPGYAPPEQYGVGVRQGPWTDFYALGAIAYKIVTGKPPVNSLHRLRNDPMAPASVISKGKYSDQLLAAIDRMLQPEEIRRPKTAREVRLLLEGGVLPDQQTVPEFKDIAADKAVAVLDDELPTDKLSVARPARANRRYWLAGLIGVPIVLVAGFLITTGGRQAVLTEAGSEVSLAAAKKPDPAAPIAAASQVSGGGYHVAVANPPPTDDLPGRSTQFPQTKNPAANERAPPLGVAATRPAPELGSPPPTQAPIQSLPTIWPAPVPPPPAALTAITEEDGLTNKKTHGTASAVPAPANASSPAAGSTPSSGLEMVSTIAPAQTPTEANTATGPAGPGPTGLATSGASAPAASGASVAPAAAGAIQQANESSGQDAEVARAEMPARAPAAASTTPASAGTDAAAIKKNTAIQLATLAAEQLREAKACVARSPCDPTACFRSYAKASRGLAGYGELVSFSDQVRVTQCARVIDGVYSARRGYDVPNDPNCPASDVIENVRIAKNRIEFQHQSRHWTGAIDQATGQISIDPGGIVPEPLFDVTIHGDAIAGAEVSDEVCGKGYFRLVMHSSDGQ